MKGKEFEPLESIDNQWVRGVLTNDYKVLKKIYEGHLPKVAAMVKKNNGTVDEARDVFQEALVVIYKKAAEPDFKLTTTFGGYLYGVSRFIWLRQLKKKHRTEVTLDADDGYIVKEGIEERLVESEKRKLFQEKLEKLGEDCQQVLKQFFNGIALKEIAQKMGYTNDYVKKKNKKCKEKLALAVRTDRRYEELKAN